MFSLFQLFFLSPAMEQSSAASCSHFPASVYLFISFPSYLPQHCRDISTFPIFISLSFHSASHLISTPFLPSFLSVISLALPPPSSFIFSLFLPLKHNHALSDGCLAPHLSLTRGNVCGMRRPAALQDENVGNVSLLSMHANRLWVFLAL